jgi:hypothetical protein
VGSAETTEGDTSQADGAAASLAAGNAQTEHLKPTHRWQMPLPRNLLDDPESFNPDTTAWEELSLASPIQAEKDRAEAGGAIIENGVYIDLIQPVYNVLDGAGEWSNVVFFGVAGVRDVVSGSVSKLYDQSGNQEDATQATSSQRPTDDTSSVLGGRVVIAPDGSDDVLEATTNASSVPFTNIVVFSTSVLVPSGGSSDHPFATAGNDAGNMFHNNANQFGVYSRSVVSGGTISTDTRYNFIARLDGANSDIRVNGTQVASGDPGTATPSNLYIGAKDNATNGLNGVIGAALQVDSKLANSVLADLNTAFNSWFS